MIREYRPEDLTRIMDIANRAWQGIYDMFLAAYGAELFAVLVPDRDRAKGEQIQSHCNSHPHWVYICEEAGRIVGFVTFRLDGERRIGEIGNNAVDPDCGLKGKGQEMYRAVLQRFRDEGMRFAKVHTGMDPAHGPARRAYEWAGFDIRHEDVDYYMKL
ncbi:MAG: GNAT family N-acetyltransferase [Lentisphaeria bacterium]|nr:GNAT family N-acetyltransferase [Lentisphaeria bacterium]